jgi:hypothetical protein
MSEDGTWSQLLAWLALKSTNAGNSTSSYQTGAAASLPFLGFLGGREIVLALCRSSIRICAATKRSDDAALVQPHSEILDVKFAFRPFRNRKFSSPFESYFHAKCVEMTWWAFRRTGLRHKAGMASAVLNSFLSKIR